jgi:hypothetical protein
LPDLPLSDRNAENRSSGSPSEIDQFMGDVGRPFSELSSSKSGKKKPSIKKLAAIQHFTIGANNRETPPHPFLCLKKHIRVIHAE